MKLINDFEAAVRNHEMKGAMHPEDHEAIELNYVLSKECLKNYIKQLISSRDDFEDKYSRLRNPDMTGQ